MKSLPISGCHRSLTKLCIKARYQRRMVLLSARKLKTFSQPIFLSKQLTKEEADLENLALVRRRELINKGTDPKNLRVRDATLFIRQGAKWTKEKLPVADE